MTMNKTKLLIAAGLVLILAGCATGGNTPPAPPLPDCQFNWDPTCPQPFPPVPPIPRPPMPPIPHPPHK